MTHIVGLDISLTGTGVAALTRTGSNATEWSVHTFRIPTSPSKGGGITDLLGRMRVIAERCAEAVSDADLVVAEEQAFGAVGSAARSLAGVWYFVIDRVLRHEVALVLVSTSQLKKYATGNGNAAKREVSRAVGRMWPHVETGSGDEDDAMVLASIGAHLLDLALPYEPTKYRTELAAKLGLSSLDDAA